MSLITINIMSKGRLEHVDLHGANKAKFQFGSVTCRLWKSGKVLVTGSATEQECRDAASRCGTVVDLKIINSVARVSLPYRLSLEKVSRHFDIEYTPTKFDGFVLNRDQCHGIVYSENLLFVGSATNGPYQLVLDELLPVLEGLKE
jgi:TATA-box binding protein (TBP) (component of TFIID and TFIIIB)